MVATDGRVVMYCLQKNIDYISFKREIVMEWFRLNCNCLNYQKTLTAQYFFGLQIYSSQYMSENEN
jgi:hypothetical protein